MQESSSSHSIPHVALSSDSKAPSISYSASQTTDMSNAPSSNTPQFKKKLLSEKSSSARESGGSSHIAKHQSFDYAKSMSFVFELIISNIIKILNWLLCSFASRFTHGITGTIG